MGPIEERCDGLMRSALGPEQPSTEPIGTATSTEELIDVLANLLKRPTGCHLVSRPEARRNEHCRTAWFMTQRFLAAMKRQNPAEASGGGSGDYPSRGRHGGEGVEEPVDLAADGDPAGQEWL
jgi:hypothetical protein